MKKEAWQKAEYTEKEWVNIRQGLSIMVDEMKPGEWWVSINSIKLGTYPDKEQAKGYADKIIETIG